MIVGSAEVVIRAIGDKLEGDIQRSLNNAAKAAGPAGEKTGDNFMEGIAKSIRGNQGQLDGALNKAFEKSGQKGAAAAGKNAGETIAKNAEASGGAGAAKAGDVIGKRIGDNVSRGLGRSSMRRGIGSILLKLGVLIPVVGILVGGISTLVSGLFAMSSTMSLAASSSVALVGALGAVGLGALAAGVGFKGVGQAIKDGLDPARAEQFAESMKKVAPAARPFIKDFIALKDEFKGIRDAAAAGLFPGLERALARVAPILPRMRNEFRVLGDAGGDAVDTITRKFTSLNFRQNMGEIVQSSALVIRDLGAAFGNLGQTMASVFAAAAPLTERFSKSLKDSTASLRDQAQAGKESGRLQSFFNRAGDAAAQMGRIIGNVAKGLFDIGKIGGSTGQRIFNAMEKASESLANYTDNKKNVEGLNKAFDGIGTNLIAIGGLAKEVGRSFLRMGASPGIARTADALKKIVPDIERALTAGIDLGPKIAQFIGELAKMFTALQQSGALGAVIDIFTAVAKAIRVLLELPFAGGIVKILAIITALRMLGRAGAFMGGVLGRNLAALDAAVGRTGRGFRTLQAPMTALNTRAVQMGRAFQTSSTGLMVLGARAQYAGTHVGTLTRTTERVAGGAHRANTRLGGLGPVLGRVGTGFKGVGVGGALASAGLLTAGAASASAGGKIGKFSATLTGAGIGAAFGGWGAPIGAAVGGLIDIGRHLRSTGDEARKASDNIKNSMKGLDAITTSALRSTGMTDNIAAWKKAQSELQRLTKQRFEAKIGADTRDLDRGIVSARENVTKLMRSIETGTKDFDIKIGFAQSMSDLNGFMRGFRSTVREIEQRTGKKFKFDIDSGPFQQASRDLYSSLRSVGQAAAAAGGPALTDFRNKIQSMRGTFGLSADGATILANKLMGLPNLLHGIKSPEKIKIDADTKAALAKMGFVESDFAQLQAAISGKPLNIDVSANGADANATIDQIRGKIAGLPPSTRINITAPNGQVVATTVGQLTEAINNVPPSVTPQFGAKGLNTTAIQVEQMDALFQNLDGTTATPSVVGQGVPNFLGLIGSALGSMNTLDSETATPGVGAQYLPSFNSTVGGAAAKLGGVTNQPWNAGLGALIAPQFGGAINQATGTLADYAGTPYKAPVSAQVAPGFNFLSFLAALIPPAPKTIPVKPVLDMGAVSAVANRIAGLRPTFMARASLDMGSVSGVANRVAGLRPTFQARAGLDMGSVSGVANRVAGLRPTFQARASLNMGSVSGVANRIAGLKPTITARTRADTKGAQASINRLRAKTVTVPTKAGTQAASAIGRIKAKTVTVNTKASPTAQSAINRIKAKTVTVGTRANTGPAQSAINSIKGKTVYINVVTRKSTVNVATGGYISGPGTGTSDSIPAMLSNGEYVIRAAMVKRYRAVLDSINSGAGIPRDLSPVVRTAANAALPVSSSSTPGGAMVMEVRGVLDLGNSKAYISGVAHQQNQSDTAYKNSLSRAGQN